MHCGGRIDLFRLMYTSGTTDRPKGVMHTYNNFYWKCMDHVIALGLTSERASAGDRTALSCRRVRSAGSRRAVGRRDALCSPRFRRRAGASLDSRREADLRLACAGHARRRSWRIRVGPASTSRAYAWVIGGGERTPESRIRAFSEYFTKGRYIDGYGLTEFLQRRHADGSRPRDRENRLGRPRAAP